MITTLAEQIKIKKIKKTPKKAAKGKKDTFHRQGSNSGRWTQDESKMKFVPAAETAHFL